MVIPLLDVSKDKQALIEKQTLNLENKTKNNHLNRQLKIKDFFGKTEIYLTNALSIATYLLININQTFENNPILLIKTTLQDEIPLQMTNMTVKKEKRGTKLTLDLLRQTVTTMNTILVLLEIVRDQLLAIGIFQIVDLFLHTTESNQQP